MKTSYHNWMCVAAVFAALAGAVSAGRAEIVPFTFIHMSDTHLGSAGNDGHLRDALLDIDRAYPDTAFIINTGDVTDLGWEEQYTSYLQVLTANTSHTVYACPGNHDARWADDGKAAFRRGCGDTYKRFDYQGVRFILMDVSMLLEQYAHFDGEQLRRLEQDLKSMPEGMPAVIAMHHPPLSEGHFFDNEQDFVEIIGRYDVPLVLTGHGHAFQRYAYNGTTYAMGGSTFGVSPQQSSYLAYHVTPAGFERARRSVRLHTSTTDTVSIAAHVPANRERFEIQRLHAEGSTSGIDLLVTASQPGRDGASTSGRSGNGTTFAVAMLWDRLPLADKASLKAPGEYFPLPNQQTPGRHFAHASVRGAGGTSSTADLLIDVASSARASTAAMGTVGAGGTAAPRLVSESVLPAALQSSPCVEENFVYVGCNDGLLRCYDLTRSFGGEACGAASGDASSDGQSTDGLAWATDLHGEIVSSPATIAAGVVVGSMDGGVYCVDKRSGALRWRFATGKAVQASPLVATSAKSGRAVVYIGSGDRNFYALDGDTGNELWRFRAARHIKATPALVDGRLFFGDWGNNFFCLDAETGREVWKVPVSTGERFSAATCNPVAARLGTVIVCSHDYSVRCFDQKTGSQLWVYRPVKDELGPSYSEGVVVGSAVYFGSINGHVVGHDLETGKKVFDVDLRPAKTDAVFDSRPLLVGEQLYVGTVGGNLYAVDLSRKAVAWSVALQPGFIFTKPALWKDCLLVASMANRLFAVQMPSRSGNAEQ